MKVFLKKCGQNQNVQKIIAFLWEKYIRFVILSSRCHVEGLENAQAFWQHHTPMILCFWHERLPLLAHIWPSQIPLVALASSHRDGQIIASFLERFRIGVVSGSTGKKGSEALRVLARHLKQGTSVCIVPDGPRGPSKYVQQGAVGLSRLMRVPIVPLSGSVQKFIRLKTWDRMIIPLPFNRIVLGWGEPIHIDRHAVDKVSMERVQDALTQLTLKVDQYIHKV